MKKFLALFAAVVVMTSCTKKEEAPAAEAPAEAAPADAGMEAPADAGMEAPSSEEAK